MRYHGEFLIVMGILLLIGGFIVVLQESKRQDALRVDNLQDDLIQALGERNHYRDIYKAYLEEKGDK